VIKTKTALCETYAPCPLALMEISVVCSQLSQEGISGHAPETSCAAILKGMLSRKYREDLT